MPRPGDVLVEYLTVDPHSPTVVAPGARTLAEAVRNARGVYREMLLSRGHEEVLIQKSVKRTELVEVGIQIDRRTGDAAALRERRWGLPRIRTVKRLRII